MPHERRRFGDWGEEYARRFLEGKGYSILESNYRGKYGEIDLVAREGECLVFVEVKLRRPRQAGRAVEQLSRRKQRRLRELAAAYGMEHPELPADQRIDLVAIDLGEDGAVAAFRHIRSAVEG